MKIGIFGGSFNPPHLGHKKIVTNLLSTGIVDKVIVVPVGNFYQKKDLIDGKYRYDMLRIMFEEEKQVEISDYEIKNGKKFTYQTLIFFQRKYPKDEIYFILGKDNLIELDTWKKSDYLKNNFSFIVIDRKISSPLKDAKIDELPNITVAPLEVGIISSTMIRKNLKGESKQIDKWLDKNVHQYIIEHQLYSRIKS